ncbi:MAG TPA: ABC transporter substrate-binding protein [Chloroflexia bacterium]|nr:ABC transporter substrate-binding protein [Chloroflexia bacterium]
MSDPVEPRRISRRAFLMSMSGISAAAVLAACTPPSTTTAPTQPPAATNADAPTAVAATAAPGGPKKEVARKDTLYYSAGPVTEIPNAQNFNVYGVGQLGNVRGILNRTVFEFLFLYNHNDGSEIPWLAESYKVADDAMSVDVALREGVTWSDGEPFTSDDVKHTIETLRDTPALTFSSDMKEWVKDVAVKDATHFTINLTKANPRFFYFYFVENSEIEIAIMPKHIWEGQDWTTFAFYDPAKGWPVGTGHFKLVEAQPQGQFYDRDDNWWGVKTGFQPASKVTRIGYIPTGASQSSNARFIANEIDADATLQPGEYVAAVAQNPKIQTWRAEGPMWGAPDACLYTLGLNTKYGPMADVHVRRAIQAAIDRSQMIDLAYEGSSAKLVVPFSTFGGLVPYTELVQDIIDKYKPDNPSAAVVESEMTEAGYTKDSDGFWVKDGARISTPMWTGSWLGPMGPVLEKQLQDAGFDITFKINQTDNTEFFNTVQSGKADIWIIVHCGSSREPWGTLQHYHSKFNAPAQGTNGPYIWANSQYDNPEYDAIIDKMDSVLPSPTDPAYTDLVRQAVDIYLRDVVEITMSEETWLRCYNNTYWTGWPSAADPYIAPYSIWAGFLLAELKVQPAA